MGRKGPAFHATLDVMPNDSARPPAPSIGGDSLGLGSQTPLHGGNGRDGRASKRPILIGGCLGAMLLVGGAVGVTASYFSKFHKIEKSAEAKNTVTAIGLAAIKSYEEGTPSADGAVQHTICPSWPHPIPRDVPHGTTNKMMGPTNEGDDPAVRCLGLDWTHPVYYQYNFVRTSDGFIATAVGDIDGDGKESHFELRGTLSGEKLELTHEVEERDPLE